MFSYYGAKTNLVDYYPSPMYNSIVEPFAGSARYSLKYFECEVLLTDAYKVVVDIWKYLQKCSVHDIMGLPNIRHGEQLKSYKWDCQEQLDLMGFIVSYGQYSPARKGGRRLSEGHAWSRPNTVEFTKRRIADDLYKIKHWKIEHSDYRSVENRESTWFIDPPYIRGGHKYVKNKLDYNELGEWSKNRKGQIIVCEGDGAVWLPFKQVATQKTSNGKRGEMMYTNKSFLYQSKLFE